MSYKTEEFVNTTKEEKIAILDRKIKEKIVRIQELDAKKDGINLEISETNPGRFKISRDYDKSKNLSRLSR